MPIFIFWQYWHIATISLLKRLNCELLTAFTWNCQYFCKMRINNKLTHITRRHYYFIKMKLHIMILLPFSETNTCNILQLTLSTHLNPELRWLIWWQLWISKTSLCWFPMRYGIGQCRTVTWVAYSPYTSYRTIADCCPIK